QAIKSHNAECREEALTDRREYIDIIYTSMRAIIKEEASSQLPHILLQAVLEFATTVIEQNITESLKTVVLEKYSFQPKSTYEAVASLSEFDLTKILMDKMEEKNHILELIIKKSFMMHWSRDDKDKDQDPSAGSDQGTKRRKLKEPSYTIEDLGVQQNQEFNTRNNDQQPNDEAVSKDDCNLAHAEKPPNSFDELIDTPIDFSTFVLNRLNIANQTQELLVGPSFNLLKGTYKSRMELEYHFEECFKATTERLNWHNPKFKQYPFDLLIYEDQTNHNRLMRTDELHKISDGMLNYIWTALHDISSGIRMDYLPKRKWSNLDKRRALVMIQDIDKQLFQRRLMRNLEKLVGGREYGEDLRLLIQTI
ncbi:hypothetical protein Tco_1063391, partial [Tanacetum coccineum]